MSPLRPGLRPAWQLRISGRRARIYRCDDGQPVAALAPLEAVLVGLMDGSRTAESLRHHFEQALGPRSRAQVDQTFDRLAPLLADGSRTPLRYRLEDLASVLEPDPTEGMRLLPGPRVLHWHVTRFCPRRCVYCYAEPEHGKHATDVAIGRDRLGLIFREASTLGATTLLVSGAEPFLRDDLPEVLGDAIAAGLALLLTTKHPISAGLAERLARAGVPHLSFSLDAVTPEQNARLIGSSIFATQMQRSMRALRAVGIAFSIQTVVTRLNRDSPREVAALAEAEGAQVMQLIPYKPVRRPLTELANAELALTDDSLIDRLAVELQARHPRLTVERFREAAETGAFHCDIGQTKLFFLPDGVVHRCYKLTDDAALRGKDLRSVSLAAAWHDAAFLDTIFPPRSDYEGSACASCDRFGACHRSGRCIYDAWVHHRQYAAPDRACAGRGHTPSRIIPIRHVTT